jgi:putative endonuclease
MCEELQPAVYILASKRNGTLYTGVTAALWKRVCEHKDGGMGGFTQKYGVKTLVWYEHHHTMPDAIRREKQIKKWNRRWKLNVIEKLNPGWRDLHDEIDVIGTLVDATHSNVIPADAGTQTQPIENQIKHSSELKD